ncbi:MAG: threonine-phosphate decarboxylase CobD [Spirochaetaceae bacterium]
MEKLKDFTHGGNVHKASINNKISKHKILDFSANINPLGLSPKGLSSIKNGVRNILNYPDPEYIELRQSLAGYYNVDIDHLIPGNGAIELIYSYVKNREVGTALIPAPGFVEYEKALLSYGWEVLYYTNKDEINTTNVDVIFICNPNNPTGSSYSESYLTELLNRCSNNNTDLFLDEAFIEFSSYKSMSSYLHKFNNLFILKSLTKFFAIPGLRLGALLTSNKTFKDSFNKIIIPWSINSVAQDYITSAIKDNRYINKSKYYIKRERIWLFKQLTNIPNLKVFRTQGNFMVFKIDLDIDLCSVLISKGILIRSCFNYNSLDSSYYRIAIKRHGQNKVLLRSLKKVFTSG